VLDWYHVVKKFKEDLSRACQRFSALVKDN
jgi:hypothetical protein